MIMHVIARKTHAPQRLQLQRIATASLDAADIQASATLLYLRPLLSLQARGSTLPCVARAGVRPLCSVTIAHSES